MNKIHHLIAQFIHELESVPTSLSLWFTSFIALIITRIAIENAVGLFESPTSEFLQYEFLHTFFFFLFSYLLLWPLVSYFGKVSPKKASSVLLFGFLIILTPPILDVWIASGEHLWSFYKFDSLLGLLKRYVLFFGDKPNIGITYGVRIEVALTVIFLGLYTFIKRKSFLYALISGLSTYTLLFILGTFPSWLTFIILGREKNILLIKDFDVAALFLSPPHILAKESFDIINSLNIKMSLIYAPLSLCLALLYFWKYEPKKFVALLKNARVPQIAYHVGLFFLGLLLAYTFNKARIELSIFTILALINICIAITFAWIASVIINDVFDISIDTISNSNRPLQKKIISLSEYYAYGYIFFAISLLFAVLVSLKCVFLILLYQALAWLYSAWVFRLKKFPLIATFFAALASVCIVILGYTSISHDGSLKDLPLQILFYLLISLTLFLPFKDLKDREGDKKDKIYTIPVLFGDKKGKLIIASFAFSVYILGVFILHTPSLFWIALLCGSASFWVIFESTHSQNKKLTYRSLPAYLLSITTLYVLSIIYSILY